ncbi:prokaryotic phospholipase A2-domain-containing protein [Pestalotiopsis sp. NC0098]|nr:prokaryotic phospholipase A2-domain-containing protein [Pestalotiopsis sp. NC0098]
MKFISTLALCVLPASVLAAPAASKRQDDVEAITDEILFDITLPEFTTRRNAQDPSYLDWTSDGCTDSPDNPLGFPYVPACNRHDFGYTNYREQSRFTVSAKASIDSNFKDDLYYQCEVNGSFVSICEALADVYYAAVVEFGGDDATPGKKRTSLYEEKLAIYNQMVAEAVEKGELVLPETA